jgi:pimeloyl-ACP methyl ester carboxylesterase
MKKIVYQSIGLYLNTLTKVSPRQGGRAGYRLFSSPQRARLKPQHLAFLNTAHQIDYDFNGINIKLYQWGSGPNKVLLVHGWQSHTYRWKKYIESLPLDEYTIVAYDAPGHGLSAGSTFTVPLNAFLISELVKNYNGFEAVVAHSIGSMSVLYAMNFYAINTIGKFVSMAAPSKASDFFAYYIDTLKLNGDAVKQLKKEFQLQVRHQLEDISLSAFAKNVEVNTLIVHDLGDPETPYQNALELHASLKNSKLVPTTGLGHNLKSTDVVRLVAEFVVKDELPHEVLKPFAN